MNFIYLALILLLVTGCEKAQDRHYTEVVTEAPAPVATGSDPHAGLDMSSAAGLSSMGGAPIGWKVPEGWKEEPAQGLRLATFRLANNPTEIDASIVPLGGNMAGGLKSNLKRWLGQINLQVSDSELDPFIESSKDNLFDFTKLQKGQKASSKSMIVSVITLSEMTVFVKMTGSIDALNRQKTKFMELANSIHSKDGQEDALPANHPPIDGMMSNSNLPTANDSVKGKLKWKAPEAWKEEHTTGMRLATFHAASNAKKIDCSIVSLAGMAGGLEANLGRWMGQIGLKESKEGIGQLTNSSETVKTADGKEVKIYDFTSLQKGASPSDNSMMAAILSTPEVSIFIKMTGSIEAIQQNRSNFQELIKSLNYQ